MVGKRRRIEPTIHGVRFAEKPMSASLKSPFSVRWAENSILRSEEDMLSSLIEAKLVSGVSHNARQPLLTACFQQQGATEIERYCCMEQREVSVAERCQTAGDGFFQKRIPRQTWAVVDESDLLYAVNAFHGKQQRITPRHLTVNARESWHALAAAAQGTCSALSGMPQPARCSSALFLAFSMVTSGTSWQTTISTRMLRLLPTPPW